MINKKLYNYLSKQEKHLELVKYDYLIGVYKDDVEYCKKIYNELGFEGPCVTCKAEIKGMYAVLSKLYYEYQNEKINKKENNEEA